MQCKHVFAALLRGLHVSAHSRPRVSMYTQEEYVRLWGTQHLPMCKVILPQGLSLEGEWSHDNDDLQSMVQAVKNALVTKGEVCMVPFAVGIETMVYVVHSLPTLQRKEQHCVGEFMQDAIVFISGAAQGIGKGIAEALVSYGAFVYIADIHIAQAQQTAEELCSMYSTETARALALDCADEASVQQCAREVMREMGGLDVLINNAGIVISGDVESLDSIDFFKTTQVNYHAYFLLVKHFSPCMKYQHYANHEYYSDIIQINSKSGLQGSVRNSAYAGSKFGGIGLTQSFALELVEHNIKVNAICPGNFYDGPLWSDPKKGLFMEYLQAGKVPNAKTVEEVRTFYEEKTPMKRGCTVQDVVKGIMYLVDQKFETGQALPISGGQVMLH